VANILLRRTAAITGPKKQSDEGAALFGSEFMALLAAILLFKVDFNASVIG